MLILAYYEQLWPVVVGISAKDCSTHYAHKACVHKACAHEKCARKTGNDLTADFSGLAWA